MSSGRSEKEEPPPLTKHVPSTGHVLLYPPFPFPLSSSFSFPLSLSSPPLLFLFVSLLLLSVPFGATLSNTEGFLPA